MENLLRRWYTFKHGRKFARKGKGCKFPCQFLEVDGHVELGDYCRFRNNTIMRTNDGGKIIFGNRSGTSYNCIIEATQLVQIGDYTGIAEFTVIRDTNHMLWGTNVNWRFTPLIAKPIIIGNSVFIGSRCYIMPGVTIGDGAAIGPGSLVTKDIGPLEIWAGYPARRIGHRTKKVPDAYRKLADELMEKDGVKKDRYVDVPPVEVDDDRETPPRETEENEAGPGF